MSSIGEELKQDRSSSTKSFRIEKTHSLAAEDIGVEKIRADIANRFENWDFWSYQNFMAEKSSSINSFRVFRTQQRETILYLDTLSRVWARFCTLSAHLNKSSRLFFPPTLENNDDVSPQISTSSWDSCGLFVSLSFSSSSMMVDDALAHLSSSSNFRTSFRAISSASDRKSERFTFSPINSISRNIGFK